ncbi:hypothetical protein TL16_g01943 [Triparma laevis f. inornata]|uniref:Uncharacterized protein n=1 Tax=Triparma laevis f. inornata TaxID=1714386 RepID=A0A9W6ZJM9_9STRA|nr:hypothetical protein TL16_g01943 [Triparma laevis f. inornata]
MITNRTVPLLLLLLTTLIMLHSITSFTPRLLPSPRFTLKTKRSLLRSSSSITNIHPPTGTHSLSPYLNPNNKNDQILTLLTSDGSLKLTLLTLRNLLNDLSLDQNLSPLSTRALGTAFTCSTMLASGMDTNQIFQLTINGDGPLRGICTVSSSDGTMKGYVGNPTCEGVELINAIGKGTVQVVKNHPDWPRPYNGISGIGGGGISIDVGVYLAQSEQRECVIFGEVEMKSFLVTGSGGYLIERLPEASEATSDAIEKNLAELAKGSQNWFMDSLVGGTDLLTVASMILGEEVEGKVLESIEPATTCECSLERLVRSLTLIPRDDVMDIIQKEENVEAKCEFCGKMYRLSPDDVKREFEKFEKINEIKMKEEGK